MDIQAKKIALVVDDEPLSRNVVSTILRQHDFHVVEGENGAEAISQYISTNPSLIIIDLNMPIMNGCDAAGVIRRLCRSQECKIILFTGEDKDFLSKNDDCHSAVNDIVFGKDILELQGLINCYTDDSV